NFGLFLRAVDKSPRPGIELSAEEDEEESAAFWRYPPVSTPCTELFRDPALPARASRTPMRASCVCSSDSDRCSSRCARTIRWLSARRAAELIRLSNSGPTSATAAIPAATATPL